MKKESYFKKLDKLNNTFNEYNLNGIIKGLEQITYSISDDYKIIQLFNTSFIVQNTDSEIDYLMLIDNNNSPWCFKADKKANKLIEIKPSTFDKHFRNTIKKMLIKAFIINKRNITGKY